jgi:hypothetical protein
MVSIKKMNRKPVATLERLMGYSAILRKYSVLSILLICFGAAGPIFAEDLPAGTCQASNALSVLVRGKNVTAYVAKGPWFAPVPGVDAVKIEGKQGPAAQIPIPEAINSCASNSVTGETVCTANNSSNVYIISDKDNSYKSLTSSAITPGPTYPPMFFEPGTCTNCGVTIDPVNNRAVIGVNLSANPPLQEGYQVLNLGRSPNFEKEIPLPQNQQISTGFLIDPTRNIILSPNQLGIYGIVKLPDNKKSNDDGKGKNDATAAATPLFLQNAFAGMPPFGSAGADCDRGLILGSMMLQDPSTVYVANLNKAVINPDGTWTFKTPKNGDPPAPSQIQTLSESHLAMGASGLAMVTGKRIGILTGEFGAFSGGSGDWITAIAIAKHTDGDNDDDDNGKNAPGDDDDDNAPGVRDWISCRVPGAFQIGLAPHAVATYQSPDTGHAMAVVANWDFAAGRVNRVAVVDLTQMLHKTKRTKDGNACALPDQSLSSGGPKPEVTFFDVP